MSRISLRNEEISRLMALFNATGELFLQEHWIKQGEKALSPVQLVNLKEADPSLEYQVQIMAYRAAHCNIVLYAIKLTSDELTRLLECFQLEKCFDDLHFLKWLADGALYRITGRRYTPDHSIIQAFYNLKPEQQDALVSTYENSATETSPEEKELAEITERLGTLLEKHQWAKNRIQSLKVAHGSLRSAVNRRFDPVVEEQPTENAEEPAEKRSPQRKKKPFRRFQQRK